MLVPSYAVPMQDHQSQFRQRLVCGTRSSPWLIFTVCLLLAALAGMGCGGPVLMATGHGLLWTGRPGAVLRGQWDLRRFVQTGC